MQDKKHGKRFVNTGHDDVKTAVGARMCFSGEGRLHEEARVRSTVA